ncbi:MAG: N-methyl-D-aspartate receptor NMDAR2C subunit [Methylococcaceae bacterium]|nr:N-methyl-D-aspartate receptor NMDAR2C subunit [Methylococcaceae bacterium]
MTLFKSKRFSKLLKQLNCKLENEASVWSNLRNAYHESHRYYHTEQHIDECLQLFDTYHYLAKKPLEVEFALWFHDAVYNTEAADNEDKSALWAKEILLHGGVKDTVITRIYNLILATAHQQQAPQTNDEKLLVDIDIAIFAASSERFAEYQQQIRKEYAWVSEHIYQQKRREVLNNFYNSPILYYCDEIRKQLEIQARLNLLQALVT